jgi:hypothetical protein
MLDVSVDVLRSDVIFYVDFTRKNKMNQTVQLFRIKKRLHGGKKGKLSPCSYIHESLTDDLGSIFTLKRRPPAKKRASEDMDAKSVESVSSLEDLSTYSKDSRPSKKCRLSTEKEFKKSKKDGSKMEKQPVASTPLQVKAEEYSPPSPQSVAAVERIQVQIITSSHWPLVQRQSSISASPTVTCQPTLLELLSTSLPPSEILFSDDVVDSVDDNGIPAWVTDNGQFHYHNVDSSLIDLAMLY